MENEQIKISRFLYLQTFDANFTNKRTDMSLQTIQPVHVSIEENVRKLAESDPKAPFNIIKKALQSKTLSRHHETWFALATMLRCLENVEAKKEIYDHLHELATTSEDLLLIVFYYRKLKDENNGFGHGMKKFLKKWYLSKTADELVEIFATKKSIFGTTHRSVLAYARFKVEDPEKSKIINYLFTHGNKLPIPEETEAAYKKLYQLHQLKRAKLPDDVIDILEKKQYEYKLENLPHFGQISLAIWEILLPTLSVKNILDYLPILQVHSFFKCETFSKKIATMFGCYKSREKLNPFFVFFAMRDYEFRCHKQEIIQKLREAKKTEEGCEEEEDELSDTCCSIPGEKKDSKVVNVFIVKKIMLVLNVTLSNIPKAGVRYFITLDFRKFSKNNSKLMNNSQVKCSEAQLLLALALFKSEKDVSLFSFTDNADNLKNIEFGKDITYEKAMEYYQNEIKTTPKTKQNLCAPITSAKNSKKKVDLFITVVDSAARTLGGGTPKAKPIDALKDYRKFMNLKMAKYIVINLSKKEPLFKHDDVSHNSKGFLEICGLGPDTLNVIEAFAKNSFV